MFTGIIQAVGTVAGIHDTGIDLRIGFDCESWDWSAVTLGDSLAVQGVCLTVVERRPVGFWADVSQETLACTTLGRLTLGARVNLEPALTFRDRLGGHLVSGHVDAVGKLRGHAEAGRSRRLDFALPATLKRYVAVKGSICVDGVSLTVNEVGGDVFAVNVVPHTLSATTLGALASGDLVNLEVDLVARYLEALVQGGSVPASGVTRALLVEHGFLSGSDGRNRV